MQKLLFYNKFIICLYMFRAVCAHHQEVKIVYTASGIITTVGGRPVHRMATYICDDTRCCMYNFDLLMMSTYFSKHVEAYNNLIIKQEFVHKVG